jgi:hypothetical protein
MYKNILAKLIKAADQPHITTYRDGKLCLTLPAMGDPYYSVDCMLTADEADELLNTFPELEVLNV